MATSHRKLPPLSPQDIEKLLASFEQRGPNECWPWIRSVDKDGYGRMSLWGHRAVWRASRVVYFHFHGTDPGDEVIRHSCDWPPCSNPNHLETGTYQQNSRDRELRGRSKHRACPRPGESNPFAKLTAVDVMAMRQIHKDLGWYGKRIHEEVFPHINAHHINRILARLAWKHLP